MGRVVEESDRAVANHAVGVEKGVLDLIVGKTHGVLPVITIADRATDFSWSTYCEGQLPTRDTGALTSPRFIPLWNDENIPDRNARRVADGLDEAIRGVHDFLDHEDVWDEEKADEEVDGDGLTPALQALADVVAGDDLQRSP